MEQQDKPYRTISIRFPSPLWKELKAVAKKNHRSFNSLVQHLLFKAVENEEVEQAVLRDFHNRPVEEPRGEGREANGTEDP